LGDKIKKRQAKYRQELGHLFSYIQKFILKTGIDDTQCGFKCFKNKVAKDIFIRQRLERFCFDVEILFIAKQLGYHIKEMPITWRNHPESKVKALVDGARMFFDLLKIRYNFMRGFYSKDNLKC
jgi:dolichyl-phosphate beta-glucosyltransferase